MNISQYAESSLQQKILVHTTAALQKEISAGLDQDSAVKQIQDAVSKAIADNEGLFKIYSGSQSGTNQINQQYVMNIQKACQNYITNLTNDIENNNFTTVDQQNDLQLTVQNGGELSDSQIQQVASSNSTFENEIESAYNEAVDGMVQQQQSSSTDQSNSSDQESVSKSNDNLLAIIITICVVVGVLIIIIVPVCITHSKETKELISSFNPTASATEAVTNTLTGQVEKTTSQTIKTTVSTPKVSLPQSKPSQTEIDIQKEEEKQQKATEEQIKKELEQQKKEEESIEKIQAKLYKARQDQEGVENELNKLFANYSLDQLVENNKLQKKKIALEKKQEQIKKDIQKYQTALNITGGSLLLVGGKKIAEMGFTRKGAIGLMTALSIVLVIGIILIIIGGVNYIVIENLLTTSAKYQYSIASSKLFNPDQKESNTKELDDVYAQWEKDYNTGNIVMMSIGSICTVAAAILICVFGSEFKKMNIYKKQQQQPDEQY